MTSAPRVLPHIIQQHRPQVVNDTIVIGPSRDRREPKGFLGKALALEEERAAVPR